MLATTILSLLAATTHGNLDAVHEPPTLSLDEMRQDPMRLRRMLEKGLVAVPNLDYELSFASFQSGCDNNDDPPATHTFSDGTVRRTIAMDDNSTSSRTTKQESTTSCARTHQDLRDLASTLSHATAKALGVTIGYELEHFHRYHAATSKNIEATNDNDVDSFTMDYHTDAGMFLVFAPARDAQGGTLADFYIDGKVVRFAPDSLIIMAGDGLHKFLPAIVPTAHAVKVTDNRVWYGRMVFSPEGRAFREQLMEQQPTVPVTTGYRQLQDCEDSQLLCWHQCMVVADFDLPDCAAQNQTLGCANSEFELWNGQHQSAEAGYAPRCVDPNAATAAVTGDEPKDHHQGNGGGHSHGDGDKSGGSMAVAGTALVGIFSALFVALL